MGGLLRMAFILLILCLTMSAQSASPAQDSATFDADGTAHITRVIPIPSTISPEARKWLASLANRKSGSQTLAERRKGTGRQQCAAWRNTLCSPRTWEPK